ncbi:uncharacterized protein [Ptychodera flava]|uniref:uncharacterized protein n=1 Tax=Ptychodera flava TaxID=63121 RepID=UPI00396AAAFC
MINRGAVKPWNSRLQVKRTLEMAVSRVKAFSFAAVVMLLQVLYCSGQPRECTEIQNYCFQSNVCAYMFHFPSENNGTCKGMLETIANMYYIEGAMELLQFHIRDINAQISTQNADMDYWQRDLDEQKFLVESQNGKIASLQNEMQNQMSAFGGRLQEYEGELYEQRSAVDSLKHSQLSNGQVDSGEIWELRSEVRRLHRRIEGQSQRIETQMEMIFNLQNELLDMQISAGCNLEYNTNREGGDVADVVIEPKRSVSQCCIACKDTPGCKSFSYNTESGECSVKSNRPRKTRVEGVISGVMP